jgi:hypothetical protein
VREQWAGIARQLGSKLPREMVEILAASRKSILLSDEETIAKDQRIAPIAGPLFHTKGTFSSVPIESSGLSSMFQ